MFEFDLNQITVSHVAIVFMAINALLMAANLFRRRQTEVGPTVGLYQMLIGTLEDVSGWDVDPRSIWKMLGDTKISVRFHDEISPDLSIKGVPEEVSSVSVGNVVLRPIHVGGKANYKKMLATAAKLRLVASDEMAEWEASTILNRVRQGRPIPAKVLR